MREMKAKVVNVGAILKNGMDWVVVTGLLALCCLQRVKKNFRMWMNYIVYVREGS